RLPDPGTDRRSSVTAPPEGMRRSTGSADTVPAKTTTLTVTTGTPPSSGGGVGRTLAPRTDTTVCQTRGMHGVERHPVLSAVAPGLTQIDTFMVGEPEFN